MKTKLINFLLEEDCLFNKVSNEKSEGLTLYGKANTIREKVFGNSKEEILQKMLNIKKEYSETAKLQLKEELIEDFKKGNKIIYPNKTYKFKYSQFVGDIPTYTRAEKGKDILKDLYYSEYFYMDASSSKYDYTTDCVQFDLVRRNNEIDCNVWSRYKTLISSF